MDYTNKRSFLLSHEGSVGVRRQDGSIGGSVGPAPRMAGPDDDFLAALMAAPPGELKMRIASLTPQERTILDFIVRGACNKDICKALDIEVTTTKVHASRIFKKLGVKNRVQAAVLQLWTLLLNDYAPARNGCAVKPGNGTLVSQAGRSADCSRVLQRETQ